MPKRNKTVGIKMRIRVYASDRMLGPGKMELLARIDRTGSLAAATKEIAMSYTRGWKLVQELNSKRPMIKLSRGGKDGGTAVVTSFGKKVLALYEEMNRAAIKAASNSGHRLARLL